MPTSCGVKDLPFFPRTTVESGFYAVANFMTYDIYPESVLIRIPPSDYPVRLP